jgi:hypothetical protein
MYEKWNLSSDITLIRVAGNSNGTFGVLLHADTPFAVTLERRWLDNQRNVSCIPWGIYRCERIDSPRFGNTFEVTNVPGRTHVLLHKGNIDDDSHGCILVGEEFEPVLGSYGIKSSSKGFGELMDRMADRDEFSLAIYSPAFVPGDHADMFREG